MVDRQKPGAGRSVFRPLLARGRPLRRRAVACSRCTVETVATRVRRPGRHARHRRTRSNSTVRTRCPRRTVGFEDIKAVAPAVLNHRMILNYQARSALKMMSRHAYRCRVGLSTMLSWPGTMTSAISMASSRLACACFAS
ncbi:MAG: hypothetical protein WD118_01840 [Phycisphaeraceae bacterium]